ncbi:MAG TPA: glutaminase A, partial [Pyrinomonadaceae bacterium]|nr:glutaminase A [Pyrinomonadaceae bacterium]
RALALIRLHPQLKPPEEKEMMNKRTLVAQLIVAILLVTSFISGYLPAQAQQISPVAPRREQVQAVVREAYDKFKNDTGGKNADYIPYLAKVDSKLFGVAVVTTDNQSVTMGDLDYSFSIQSISKVYSMALAMEEFGPETVFQKIGSEPTGRAFNSVFAVADMPTHTGNPFVNAGAISTVSLIQAQSADEKWNKILDFYSRVAGERLKLIDEVYKSEAATNTGNKALSMLLAKYDRIYADPFESVDVYTKQCSVGVNVLQLARMGATLANNGKNPATGEQVIKAENVPYILSTMMMAGLYDGSGSWSWHVGLPAKSGVGGGIVAVMPGKGAIAVFAPPLDEAGNSVKAQKVIEYVAKKLDYNLYSPGSVGLKPTVQVGQK